LNIYPDLKQEVHLFLRSYTGYLEAKQTQDLYCSLIEKSKDISELDEKVKQEISSSITKGDTRLAETIETLHEKIKSNFFMNLL